MVVLAAVIFGVQVVSVALLIRRRRPAAVLAPDKQVLVCPTQPGVPLAELLAVASVISYEVQITEIVNLEDEILVGTTAGSYELHVPLPDARRRTLDRLHVWRLTNCRLTAFHSPVHDLAGLADERSGQFLAA